MSYFKKNILEFISSNHNVFMVLISAFCLIITFLMYINSCQNSKNALKTSLDSNQIAKEALNLSKDVFDLDYRPYLSVKIIHKKTPELLYVRKNVSGIPLKYKIKNIGKVTARNIRYITKFHLINKQYDIEMSDDDFRYGSHTIDTAENLSLSPGETDNLNVLLAIHSKIWNENTVEIFRKVISTGSIRVTLTVEFGSEVDDKTKFSIVRVYLIHGENAFLLSAPEQKLIE